MATAGSVKTSLWLQNAGFVFVPFIAASAFAAWFGMDDIATHEGLVCRPVGDLPADAQLDHVLAVHRHLRFVHRLLGGVPAAVEDPVPGGERAVLCLPRAAGRGSWRGRSRVSRATGSAAAAITLWVFVAMASARSAILYAIGMKERAVGFPVFFASFLFLFAASGVGNASTFQMIPAIMRKEVARLEPGLAGAGLVRQSDKEAAAIIGFTSAVAAFGAFFIPKSFGHRSPPRAVRSWRCTASWRSTSAASA